MLCFFVGVHIGTFCEQPECADPLDATAWAESDDAWPYRNNSVSPTPEVAARVITTGRAPIEAARKRNEGNLDLGFDPCVPTADSATPCSTGRSVEFPGWAPKSMSYPDRPPTLEAMLFGSSDSGRLTEIPEHALLSSTHIVARGRFVDDSLRGDGFAVVNPDWAVDHVALGVPDPPEGQ